MTKRVTRVRPVKPRPVGDVIAAVDCAIALGHKTYTKGRTMDCWLCPATGLVGPDGTRIGDIFERSCGK